ncbi:MAG TPA: damage-inducible protein [Stellaceae bacterium]|nr:damage-inducible protein [Stellaceae bacterium]
MRADKTLLSSLRERVRQIERGAAARHGAVPLGLAAIDRALAGGGLLRGAVHEIFGAGGDEEDGALPAAFAAHLLSRLAPPAGDSGAVLWCLARPDLYGPGLAALGLDPARLVLVRAPRDELLLMAIEEGLRPSGVAAVAGEIGRLDMTASRRLQLAAEHSGVTLLLLRRWRSGEEAARERERPSAAATRWRVAALPSRSAAGEPGVGSPRWRVELLRCRGGRPAQWDVEVADAPGALSVAAAMADRPAPDDLLERRRRAG